MSVQRPLAQLTGRYLRLRQELAAAYSSVPWNTGHIDRLADDLVATERDIAATTLGDACIVKTPSAAIDEGVRSILGPLPQRDRVGSAADGLDQDDQLLPARRAGLRGFDGNSDAQSAAADSGSMPRS